MTQPPIPPIPSIPSAPQQDIVSTMIPYRNVPALIAYYLGIFSLIPCIGLLLGIAALILGIMGLKRAGQNPEAKGKVHAWIGIILGGLCALANMAFILIAIAGAIASVGAHR